MTALQTERPAAAGDQTMRRWVPPILSGAVAAVCLLSVAEVLIPGSLTHVTWLHYTADVIAYGAMAASVLVLVLLARRPSR